MLSRFINDVFVYNYFNNVQFHDYYYFLYFILKQSYTHACTCTANLNIDLRV